MKPAKRSLTEPDTIPEGDDLARQTAQAKLLRGARNTLGVTSDELAERLGVKPATLQNWLYPTTSRRHRDMPETAKLLLGYILKEKRVKK